MAGEKGTANLVTSQIPSPKGRAGETILVVDDDRGILDAIRRILENAGYRVIAASTPMQAIEIASDHQEPIHVLLTDVGLLGATGPQLAKLLVAGRPGLRVLYISGHREVEEVPVGRVGAGIAFLQKPFSTDSLLRQLGELLEHESVAPRPEPDRTASG